MFAPDVSTTEGQLQQQVSAAQEVTQYCQAVTTLVPAYAEAVTEPDLQKMLQTVQTDTQTWSNNLCAACTQDVPNQFVTFNSTFTTTANRLTSDCQALENNPNDASARADLLAQLQNLLSQLQQIGQQTSDLQTQLVAFENITQNDHTLIANGLATLASDIPHGSTIIQSVQADLGVNFFSSQQLSPCIAIIQIDEQVSLKVTETAASAPVVIPFVLAQSLLTSLQTNNEHATAALSNILDTWQSLSNKYQSVITDVTNADSSQIGSIVQQLDIQAAATAWQQLAQFASQFTQNE